MFHACDQGDFSIKIMNLLIQHGADVNVKDGSGRSIIYKYAKDEGSEDLLAYFIEKGIDPETEIDGEPLLIRRLMLLDHATALLLLDNGADPNSMDDATKSTLYIQRIFRGGHYEDNEKYVIKLVKKLLEKGARVNALSTVNHFTPLMMAASRGYAEVIELLLKYGADPTLRDTRGQNAREHALNARVNLRVLALLPEEK